MLANVHRDPKKSKTYTSEDFFPTNVDKPSKTWEEMLAFVEMLNEAFGGQDLRDK